MKRRVALLLIVALILSFIPVIAVNAADTVTATITFDDTSKRTVYNTSQQVWEENGITVTNDKASSTTNVGNYSNPVRFYAKSKLTIEYPQMTQMVITCGSSSYATAMNNSIGTVSGATVTVSGSAVTVVFSSAVDSFVIASFTAQVRVKSIVITANVVTTDPEDPTEAPSEEPTEEPTEAPTEAPVPTYNGTFYKLTAENQLTTGKYVMVLKDSYAMSVLDSNWVLSEAFTPTGDSIANPATTLVWDITVTDGTVTLKDSNGAFIKPNSTSSASISSGEHNWAVAYTDGTFQFVGSGDYSAFTLAANSSSSYKLRAYKSSTVSGNSTGYPSYFTLYRLVEEGTELPTVPPTEPTEEPTEAPTEAPTVSGTFYKLTASNQLTTGRYVAIVGGYAVTYYDTTSNWILSEALTVEGDAIVNPAQVLVWDITVTDGTVTLKDSNGTFIAPIAGDNVGNGLLTDEYGWTAKYADGTFQFTGTGSDTNYLAANKSSSYQLRSYKDSTVTGNPTTYISNFTLYRLVEDGTELPTTPTDPTEAPTDPTEAPTEAATEPVADITYVYTDAGSYSDVIINWGTRGETATALSPNAVAFYNANNTSYGVLSALSGSATTSNVPDSALYDALQKLMVNNHDTITSYDDLKDLLPVTDTQKSDISNLTCFYTGNSVSSTWDSAATWNREHVWPKSKNSDGETANGNGDVMALRASNPSINSSRGNKAFGLVTDTNYYYPNNNTTEHDIRGDAARSILYSYVRWNYASTSTTFGTNGVIESVEVLLTWMEADPVDTWEMGRNDSVESITGTRNVFIDYPELAFLLFGETIPTTMTTPSGNAAGQTPTDPTEPETQPTEPETQPTEPATEPAVSTGYQKITSLAELTTGKYVIVGTSGNALTVFDGSSWVLADAPTIDGDVITVANANGFIWDITVDGTSATLADANGVFIKPKAGNYNGIQSGEYSWAVTCADGTFQFNGTGSDTSLLAWNKTEGKFRSYKTSTVSGNTTTYQANFTLYKLVEGSSEPEEDTILVGATHSIHLVEPWALRTTVQFAKNTADNLIPVSQFTSYGAYAIIGDKFDGATVEDLMADSDAVHYSSTLGNVTAGETSFTFDFYDGLYSYNLGETVYWVAYFVTAEGTHYTSIQSKSLVGVADNLLGKEEVSAEEKAVLTSMKNLKDAVIALRGNDADLGTVYAPGAANPGTLGDRNTEYQFGTGYQIKLIEPWGVRVRVLMREKTAAAGVYADYANADDYGLIFFHDVDNKYGGAMTAAQMKAETGAFVYSKLEGNAAISANGVTAVYDHEIYTQDLDSKLYCLPYIVVDGEYYYPANVISWNLLAEMTEYSQNTELSVEERAVFSAMLAMYESVQAKLN